ncbi:MAG: alpha/beta hydrolase [Pirellulales bacterium]|nr:alpha/beta hydrolase [Pirellulales bacterium]
MSKTGVHRCLASAAWCLSVVVLVTCSNPCTARGQAGDPATPPPPPKDLQLTTADKVELKATYFAGTAGRDTVPIIILHAYKGRRHDVEPLALLLQQAGHAVLAPDLRGHGESVNVVGASRKLEADTLPAAQFPQMVREDLEACKKYLMEQHNAGALNIEKLCVIGSEMGATVALLWARLDWSWPPLATGKQGQDVRALVLISPIWAFKSLKAQEALADPRVRKELSVFILVGKEKRESARDAQRLNDLFSTHHPEPPQDKRAQLKDLFFQGFDTSLQGTQLLDEMPKAGEQIVKFIELRLVKQEIPWKARKTPLGP